MDGGAGDELWEEEEPAADPLGRLLLPCGPPPLPPPPMASWMKKGRGQSKEHGWISVTECLAAYHSFWSCMFRGKDTTLLT